MRTVTHPGPAADQRMATVACKAVPVEIALKAGLSVNEAVTGGLAEQGFDAGYVMLRDVELAPLAYVIPATAPDTNHIAWYSDTRNFGSARLLEAGCMTGLRDAKPFLHCHGLWEAGGIVRMGHLLPFDSVIGTDTTARAWGIDGAAMVARDDPETSFRLFAAEATSSDDVPGSLRPAILATVTPNQDIGSAIAEIARRHGHARLAVHGIGSFVGCRLQEGDGLDWHANEVLIVDGEFDADGPATARIEAAVVDREGRMVRGVLAPGANAVSVTFELLLVAPPHNR
ncbi:MAG: PCC domain-containing protein [Rhizobiaceae bacterium]